MTDWLVRIGMACYVLDLPEDRAEAQEAAPDAVLYWPCGRDYHGQVLPRGTFNPFPYGEQHRSSVLTDHDIVEIRRLRADGWELNPIAQRFGVSISHVCRICRRQVWGHVA